MKPRDWYAQLDKLWVMRLLVEAGSFREAAHRAHVTPSAVSQIVTALEKFFGKSMLVRERGRVAPTPFCTEVLRAIEPAFGALDSLHALPSMEEGANKFADRPIRLTLGAYESLAVNLLPKLLPAIAQRYPALKFSIRTGRSGALSSSLRQGELDLALVIENDLIRNLEMQSLAEDGLGLYAAPGHAVHGRGWGQIFEFPLASLSAGKDGYPAYFRRFAKSLGPRFKPSIECDSFETLRVLAVAGVAIAVLPHRVARRTRDDLIQLQPRTGAKPDAGLHRICLLSRKGVDESAKNLLFRELRKIMTASQGL